MKWYFGKEFGDFVAITLDKYVPHLNSYIVSHDLQLLS